ncbi:hypothetical protein [Rubritalea tangerina]|uniref:ATP-grasp domain-containing protein n=1 Tax=Rubritalea tangerina TaxID=430798 RepID=A0ABW4ZBL4_9BACT
MKKILITSVGSLVGQNILDSLEGRRDQLHIIGTNSIASAANNFRCDSTHLVAPATDQSEFISDLLNLIKDEAPDLIIPGRDDDIEILASIKEKYFPSSNAFLCGSSHFAAVMDDKVKSYDFCLKHQLNFAHTIETGLPNSYDNALDLLTQYDFPLIAKPKSGNGSRGIWVITNHSQLSNSAALKQYAIQPLIAQKAPTLDTSFGIPFVWEVPETSLYAAQALISQSGDTLSSICFVSTMVMGKCEKMTKVEDPDLTNLIECFAAKAAASGWRGPLNVQFKKDTQYHAIEMNGRFSGGTSARLILGFDEVQTLLNHWLGEPIIPDSPRLNTSDTIIKSLVDFPLNPQDVAQLNDSGTWSAPTLSSPASNLIPSS